MNEQKLFQVAKKQKSMGRMAPKPKRLKSTSGLFEVTRIEHSKLSFSTTCRGKPATTVEYEQFSATAATTLDPEWHRKTQMIMKKRLPAKTTIRVLFPRAKEHKVFGSTIARIYWEISK